MLGLNEEDERKENGVNCMKKNKSRSWLRTVSFVLAIILAALMLPVTATAADAPAPPVFSAVGGFYEQAFSLSISAEPGAEIRYTTDGSVPTASSSLYTGPITVSAPPLSESPMSNGSGVSPTPRNYFNARVIKAKAFTDGGALSSAYVTNTYFIDESISTKFSMPIMAISLEPSDFVGPTGMYSNPYTEYEPQTMIEYYNPDGSLGFMQDALIKISGHASRGGRKKSIRINFPKGAITGQMLGYKVLGDVAQNFYSRELVAQQGKITARVTDWDQTTFKESVTASIAEPLRPETMNAKPLAIFINGEFWGIYETREEGDNNYIAQHYPGIKKSQVVALAFDWDTANAGYRNDEPLYRVSYDEGPDGREDTYYGSWMAMYNAMTKLDLTVQENYETVKSLVDIDSFIDYFLVYAFSDNDDWPGNNVKCWRTVDKNDSVYGQDQKWRFILHDFDSLAYNGANTDRIASFTTSKGSIDPRQPTWATEMFRNLFTSEEFRNTLAARYSTYTGTTFAPSNTMAQIDALVAARENDMGKEIYRWNHNGGNENDLSQWKNRVNSLKNFLNARPANMLNHIRNHFNNKNGLSIPSSYTNITFVTDASMGYFDVSGAQIRPDLYDTEMVAGWSANYMRTLPVTIKANPLDGSKFSYFEVTKGSAQAEMIYDSTTVITPAVGDSTISVKAVYSDASVLKALYDANKDKQQGSFTPNSWAAFTAALTQAQTVLEKGVVTQQEINDAAAALTAAIEGLTEIADKSALKALIDFTKALAEEDYTSASWAGLATALANANTVADDANATQMEVSAAQTALQSAIDGLTENAPADKSELIALVASTETLVAENYTPASWLDLITAREEANGVIDDPKATQAEVAAAQAALQTAIDGLQAETGEPIEVDYYQEDDAHLFYSSGWVSRVQIGKFMGHIAKQANKKNESMTFTFKGDYFELLSYQSYSQGMFDVYVDGEKVGDTVDLYVKGADANFKVPVAKTELPYGEHIVTVVIVGKYSKSVGYNMYIDAVGIRGEFVDFDAGALVDDEVLISTSKATTFDVLLNDDVPEGTEITDYSQPSKGTLELVDGMFVFTPTTMDLSGETFTYTAAGKTATVYLNYAASVRYEENFPVIQAGLGASNAWKSYSLAAGKAIRSSKKGDTITVTFNGTGIDIIGYKSWTRGNIEVIVDGVSKGTFESFDKSYDKYYNTSIAAIGGLAAGEHTLAITDGEPRIARRVLYLKAEVSSFFT